MKGGLRRMMIDAVTVVLGSLTVAAGLVIFTIPNDIAPGGVSGLATALAHISTVPVGAWTLIVNVPLVILAWNKLGVQPLIKTIAATLILSFGIDYLTPVLPHYTNNLLLSSVLGGVVTGAGMAALFVRGASTGGTDLISMMLGRLFPNVSMGMLLLCIDALVVVFAVFVFREIEVALYSIVSIYATSRTVDSIMQGVDHAKVIYVVTENGAEITARIERELGGGVTILPGRGGYSDREKQVLMIVTHRNSFAQTLRAAKELDGGAFIFVSNAAEVHGEGFKPI